LAHFWKAEILANPTAHEVKSLVVLMEKSRGSHAKLFQQLDLPPVTAYLPQEFMDCGFKTPPVLR
jgi:hypothetical protein